MPHVFCANASDSKEKVCPVFGSKSSDDKCRAGADKKAKADKCPVGGVMPQSEKCSITPNYKKTLSPTVDFYENDNEFKVFAELPGVQKSDIKVDVKDKVLTLTAESKPTTGQSGESARFTARKFGVFSRTIPLPSNVAAAEKIEAKLENGVLAIIVPKGTPSVTKSITIS